MGGAVFVLLVKAAIKALPSEPGCTFRAALQKAIGLW